jgi:Fic family protein
MRKSQKSNIKSADSHYAPPYTLSDDIVALVGNIAEIAGSMAVTNPTPLHLRRINQIRTVHGSVGIEGNTLTEEQITAILEGKRVLAPPREILEVQNAITAYEKLPVWNADNEDHLLAAHAVMLHALIKDSGKYRKTNAGVMGKTGIIHIAPPADRIPFLVKQLLQWLATTTAHPLIRAAVFHYELEVIHPFADGNGRMGRLWQTKILGQWNPVFYDLAIENMVYTCQPEYYTAINQSNAMNDAAPFVLFMLGTILKVLETEHVTDHVTDHVRKLLLVLSENPLATPDIMKKLRLRHRPTFAGKYLQPALAADLVSMTQPQSPRSPTQKYKLSGNGIWLQSRIQMEAKRK